MPGPSVGTIDPMRMTRRQMGQALEAIGAASGDQRPEAVSRQEAEVMANAAQRLWTTLRQCAAADLEQWRTFTTDPDRREVLAALSAVRAAMR